MNEEQREIRRKKRVIAYAESNGNVNRACRRFGVARSTFYLWRERYRKDGHWYLAAKPSKKSVKRIKERISAWLRPGNQRPREVVVGRLNQILRGWANYFGYGTRLMAYRAVDNYVTERMRGFLRRRHKVGTRGALRFSAEWIFETLGVQRLRPLHVGRPSCAGCETSRGAGCGKTARPVR